MLDWAFFQKAFVFMFVLLYRVCTHLRLVILETSLCVYVCVVVYGVYTRMTGDFRKELLCSCLCWCIGYVHMLDQKVW